MYIDIDPRPGILLFHAEEGRFKALGENEPLAKQKQIPINKIQRSE
jgi:hypothetical protein